MDTCLKRSNCCLGAVCSVSFIDACWIDQTVCFGAVCSVSYMDTCFNWSNCLFGSSLLCFFNGYLFQLIKLSILEQFALCLIWIPVWIDQIVVWAQFALCVIWIPVRIDQIVFLGAVCSVTYMDSCFNWSNCLFGSSLFCVLYRYLFELIKLLFGSSLFCVLYGSRFEFNLMSKMMPEYSATWTLEALQTETDTIVNSVDSEEMAQKSCLLRIYTICHSVWIFIKCSYLL